MFIAIPVGMNYRTERLPLVTFSLMGVNTLVFLTTMACAASTDGASEAWVYSHLWLKPAACTWYAPFTSMFVHANLLHLMGNMLFLFLFGSCVEDLLGRLRFAVFYLVGGLVADLGLIAMTPDHFHSLIPGGGASGAISACMGMYLLLRADAEIEFKYFLWLVVYVRAGEFEIPAWVAILFWFGRDLLFGTLTLAFGRSGGGVGFGAHVGGLLGGLALVAAYRLFERRRQIASAPSGPIIDASLILSTARAAARPLPATSEVPTIFLHDGRQQTGPFTLTAVQAMLQRGEISPAASYWSEGMSDWQSVVELAGQPG